LDFNPLTPDKYLITMVEELESEISDNKDKISLSLKKLFKSNTLELGET